MHRSLAERPRTISYRGTLLRVRATTTTMSVTWLQWWQQQQQQLTSHKTSNKRLGTLAFKASSTLPIIVAALGDKFSPWPKTIVVQDNFLFHVRLLTTLLCRCGRNNVSCSHRHWHWRRSRRQEIVARRRQIVARSGNILSPVWTRLNRDSASIRTLASSPLCLLLLYVPDLY